MLPEHETDEIISIYGFPGDMWNGISGKAALEKELAEIRNKKIITVISEEREVAAVGAIIDVPEKYAPLAIGIFLPLYRFSPKQRSSFIKLVKEYADKISLYLNKQN
jgi:DNA-binding IclR family transcriptional regulator